MTNQFKAVVHSDNETLYVLDRGDPEVALAAGIFTPNPSEAQVFEGIGWAEQVAGLGAVLERAV